MPDTNPAAPRMPTRRCAESQGAHHATTKPAKRRIAVALQGGGSHGAFTWGVQDRLLIEPSFDVVGISGTSAGAMNAGILADRLRRGGPAQARTALERYWQDVGRLPGFATLAPAHATAQRAWHLEHNPLFLWFDMLTRVWSLYQSNPLNYNPPTKTEVPRLTACQRGATPERPLRTSHKNGRGPLNQPKGRHRADRVRRDHIEPIDCPLNQGRFEAKRHCGAEQAARREDRSHESQLPNLHAEVEKKQRNGDRMLR
jgi:hypothetical protein